VKLLAGLLLVLAILYAFYVAVLAAWSYYEASVVVDRVLTAPGRLGAEGVRAAILRGVAEAGLRLDERHVAVSETEQGLVVRLTWSQPVLSYQGRELLELPLVLERVSRP
jgi:hypothetical protein